MSIVLEDELPITNSLLNDSGSFNEPIIQTDLNGTKEESSGQNGEEMKRDGLTSLNIAAYSVGHFSMTFAR